MDDQSDPFEDYPESEPSDAKLSRKHGEKLRRDRLNNLITQLAEEVPTIKYAHRRLDKSSILRLTVSYMKLQKGIKEKRLKEGSCFSKACLLQGVYDSAVLVATETGDILFVSPKVHDLLGFYQTDMIGYPVERFLHPDDVAFYRSQIMDSCFNLADIYQWGPETTSVETIGGMNKVFYVRMQKLSRKRQDIITQKKEYELMKFYCCKEWAAKDKNGSEAWTVACIMPQRQEKVMEMAVKISEFSNNNEWASLHKMDGTIISVDQRVSLFHGYMVSEILGKTPYFFIQDEDLESVALSHKLIMKDGQIPSTVFRMKNLTNKDLFVRSQSVIVLDKWTKQPKNIVSVNTVLSDDEGRYQLEEQKRKVDEIIAQSERLSLMCSDECSSDIVADVLTVKEEVCEELEPISVMSESTSSSQDSCTYLGFISRTASIASLTSGRQLCEVYDEMSRSFPDLYSNESSRSDCQGISVKRSHDQFEEDSDALSSDCCCQCNKKGFQCADSNHKNCKKHPRSIASSMFFVSSRSQSLSPDRGKVCDCDNKTSQYVSESCGCDATCGNTGHSILQGILEANRVKETVHNSLLDDSKAEMSDPSASDHILVEDIEKPVIPFKPLKTERETKPAPSAVQSPTIDSSGSKTPSTIQNPCLAAVNVHFSSQLREKHAKLSQTFINQKATIESLCQELHLTKNNLHMDTSEEMYHMELLYKIEKAEEDVKTQGQLLQELHEELQSQKLQFLSS